MISNLNFQRFIKESKAAYSKNKQTIGSKLKHYRKEKGLTLEESSQGICSVSYLSKLENNLIIPSEEFVEKLKKRLKIGDENNDSQTQKEIENILCAIKEGTVTNYEFSINDSFDYRSKLIRYISAIFKNLKIDFENIISDLLFYTPHFTLDEFKLFLYTTAYGLFKKQYYQKSSVVLKELLSLDIEKDVFYIKVKKLYILCLFKLAKHMQIKVYYDQFIIDLVNHHLIEDVTEVQEAYLIYKSYEGKIEEVDALVDNFKNLTDERKIFIKALVRFFSERYYDALEYSKRIMNNNVTYKIYHLLILDKLGHYATMINLIDGIKNETMNKAHDIIVNYLTNKINNHPFLITYLKNELDACDYVIEDTYLKQYLYNELTNLYYEKKFYKEAYKTSRKYIQLLKEMVSN